MYVQISYRGVAQLVERAVWDREVGGSRPSTPTSKLCLQICARFLGPLAQLVRATGS